MDKGSAEGGSAQPCAISTQTVAQRAPETAFGGCNQRRKMSPPSGRWSMLKAIIFDLDGTLVDTLPDIAWATQQSLAEVGLPVHPQSLIREFIGEGARRRSDRRLLPGHTVQGKPMLSFNAMEGNRLRSAPLPGESP